LIFEADDSVPVGLTGGSGKIGIRLPAHPVAKALTKAWGGPITGTSANRTGGPAVSSVADLDPHVQAQVDLILDAGDLAGGSGSTILDASIWPPKLIREGAVSQRAVDRAVRIG
jgi:L-threonylcarbamoyladenylate synthase